MNSEPYDPAFSAALTAEAPFLQRLAHGLVRDAAAAQDVVQDTLTVAWSRRGTAASPRRSEQAVQDLPPERLRAWLATVLRQTVSAGRRRRGATASAEPLESVASESLTPERIAERVEAQSTLAQAVASLEGVYRDAVVLRYQDELSVAQIAELRGVAASTVRSRLGRGLAQLRESLDRGAPAAEGSDTHRGVPPWLAAVAPLLPPRPEPLSGSLASSLPTLLAPGTIAMSATKTLALLVGVTASAAALWTFIGASKTVQPPADQEIAAPISAPQAPAVSTATPPGGARQRIVLDGREAAASGSADGAGASVPATVHGRVMLTGGVAVPGVDVVATVPGGRRPVELGRATTDAGGVYALDVADAADHASVRIAVDVDRTAPAGCSVQHDLASEEHVDFTLDGIVVRLHPPAALSGAPTDLQSASGLRVMQVTEGGERGERSFTRFEPRESLLLKAGPAYVFHVSYGVYEHDDHVAFLPRRAVPEVYDLDLRPDAPELGSITASIHGAAGTAAAGEELRISFQGTESRITGSLRIAADGSPARLSGLLPDTYRVRVKRDSGAATGWLLPVETESTLRVEAGEDTAHTIDVKVGGRCRWTATADGLTAGAVIEGGIVCMRRIGAKHWMPHLSRSIDPDELLPFPVVGRPMMIDALLDPGAYEFMVTTEGQELGPFHVEVLPGRAADLEVALP